MNHLALFAKYWEAGKVKTRLAKRIGDEMAREIYQLFLNHLIVKFSEFGDNRSVVFTPLEREIEFRNWIPSSWDLEAQSGGDLGCRMRAFFQANADIGVKNILIGSDTPDLPVEYLQQTIRALDREPVVIGPSGDGGYYLIACRGPVPPIFDGIPWSTEQVLPLTLERLAQERCGFKLLPELRDVDEFADLERLIAKLRQHGTDQELLKKLEALELEI